MKDYEYIDENGDYIDYWTLVEDNKELCRENQQFRIQISAREENYKKLEDNWNKLKEYIEQEISVPMGGREFCCYSNIRDKITELERGVSDEN